ncbi:MAG: acyl-CoA thioesterase [Planctomycetes bacterium]|nr:acyl-CoA thioesterase [Planctomycetota bacterium]
MRRAAKSGGRRVRSRYVRESEVHSSFIVMPEMANPLGTLFGGALMAEVDKAAGMCAHRHARRPVVTASIEHLDFISPVKVGWFVSLHARMRYAARTSMEVGVTVTAEEPDSGRCWNPCNAVLTFVAMDRDRPAPIPELLPLTDEERARHAEASERYAARRRGRP